MKGEVLLARGNAFVEARYRMTVTKRMLRDWVEEGLVPGPKAVGRRRGKSPDWQWSLESYHRLLRLCRLKQAGIHRFSALRLELWFRGADFDADTLRDALGKEWRRLKRKLVRAIPSGWDPRVGQALPLRSQRALLKAFGTKEPALVDYVPETLLPLAESLLFERDAGRHWCEALTAVCDQLGLVEVPGLLEDLPGMGGLPGMLSVIEEDIAAPPDNACEENTWIQAADKALLEDARMLLQLLVQGAGVLKGLPAAAESAVGEARERLHQALAMPEFRLAAFGTVLRTLAQDIKDHENAPWRETYRAVAAILHACRGRPLPEVVACAQAVFASFHTGLSKPESMRADQE